MDKNFLSFAMDRKKLQKKAVLERAVPDAPVRKEYADGV